ncbi:MAG: oligosaccharide flippase family protein [Clostridiales bacterium]|nr:oligosaccharide flippase family protein [Clostridiales bacterium]
MTKLLQKYNNCPMRVKASFWFLICAFLQKGISVITTPIFTRLLSTAEWGQYNVFSSWRGILGVFISLNLSYGVYVQGLVKFESEARRFSSSLQGLTLSLVVGWTAVYLLFHDFWNGLFSMNSIQMLSMLSLIWTTAVFGFWAEEQKVHCRYRLLIFITLVVSIVKPVLGIFLVTHAEDKVTVRILGLALVELVMYIGLFNKQMLRGRQFYSAKFWKYALLYNLPLIPHYLSQTVLSSCDRIMIERMIGADSAGIYSLAYSVSLVAAILNTSVMQTLKPWIYRKIKEKNIGNLANISYITMIIVAMANILLIVFAPEIIAFFAPASYHDAIWIVPPVAMSVYFMYCYDLFAEFAFYYEKTRFIMSASVLGAVLNIILNYIFIGQFGYRAAGYTTLACYVIYDIGHYFFMNKVCDEFCDGIRPYELRKILAISITFVLFGFIILFTYGHALIRYGTIAIFFVIIVMKRKSIIDMLQKIVTLKRFMTK